MEDRETAIISFVKASNGEDFLFGREYGWFYKPWEHCPESIIACFDETLYGEVSHHMAFSKAGNDLVIMLNDDRFIAKWEKGTSSAIWNYSSILSIEKTLSGIIKINGSDDNFKLFRSDIDSKVRDKFIKFIKIKIGEIEPEPDPNKREVSQEWIDFFQKYKI